MTKTRKRASANSPVVVTDHGDGIKEYAVDPEMAEQLSSIFPTEVIEEKSKIGSGSNLRIPPRSGESSSALAARRKRNTTRIKLPADGLPAETNPTTSEMAQRKLPPDQPVPKYPAMLGRFAPGVPRLNPGEPGEHHSVMGRFEDSRVSGAVKPSDAARIHSARKKRMYTSIMGRFAKSALTEDQKAALVDAMTDENARTISMSVKVLGALLDLDNDDLDNGLGAADRNLVEKMASYVVVAQQAIKDLLLEHKAADELPELLAAMSEYKRVSESVIAGLLAEKAARNVGPVEVDEVKDAPMSLTDAEIKAVVDKTLAAHRGLSSSVRQERKMATSFESFEDVERQLQRNAERRGR
jgi:hypothetical protein